MKMFRFALLTLVSLFIISGTAYSQAPTLTMTQGGQRASLTISHPRLGSKINWGTFQVMALAPGLGINTPVNITAGFIGLATPGAGGSIAINQGFTSAVARVRLPLTGIRLWAQLCTITGQCGTSSVMFRNATCYPSATCTTANNPMGSGMGTLTGSIYDSSPFYFSTTTPKVISKFRGIGNGFGTVNFSNYTWVLNIWKATNTQTVEQVWVANPTNGNQVNQLQLTAANATFATGRYEVTLTPQSGSVITTLPAGNYLISVSAVGSPGWYWSETTSNLGSDIFKSDVLPPATWLTYTALNYSPGSQALDMFGW